MSVSRRDLFRMLAGAAALRVIPFNNAAQVAQAVVIPIEQSPTHTKSDIIVLEEVLELSIRQLPDPIQFTVIGDHFNHYYYPHPTEHIIRVDFRRVSERLSEVLMELRPRRFSLDVDSRTKFEFTGILRDYALNADYNGEPHCMISCVMCAATVMDGEHSITFTAEGARI